MGGGDQKEIGKVQILDWNLERDSEISPLAQMRCDSPKDLIEIVCAAPWVVNRVAELILFSNWTDYYYMKETIFIQYHSYNLQIILILSNYFVKILALWYDIFITDKKIFSNYTRFI